MTDLRVVRTRSSLHRAAKRLATERSLSKVTVSQFSVVAGVNRATFYNHFETPADVLASLLSTELDPIRAECAARIVQPGADHLVVFGIAISQVLDHIERYHSIYRISSVAQSENTTHLLLADHFLESVRLCLTMGVTKLSLRTELDSELVAQFIAHSIVGAIESWVQSEDMSRDDLLNTILHTLPSAWFASAQGAHSEATAAHSAPVPA